MAARSFVVILASIPEKKKLSSELNKMYNQANKECRALLES